MKSKILIYDDDVEILLLCKIILNKFQYVTETLTKCDNILDDINTVKPDLILMDLWIPEKGGEKAIAIAKQNQHTKDIPILVFSANADIEIISKRVLADGYIEKPFTISVFLEKVRLQLPPGQQIGDAHP